MKRFLLALIGSVLVLSLIACTGGELSENSGLSDGGSGSGESVEASDGVLSEAPVIDSDKIEDFPEEKMSNATIDDGNFYIKVQTISGEDIAIREFAQSGEKAYSSVSRGDTFEWFYSDGDTTFSFDDEKKVYELYAFGGLSVDFGFDSTVVEDGTCSFFEEKCKYVKYSLASSVDIIHFYRESDDSWLGFQYVDEGQYGEVNLVLESSDEYPTHVKFAIPDDYKSGNEQGDNVVSIDWS